MAKLRLEELKCDFAPHLAKSGTGIEHACELDEDLFACSLFEIVATLSKNERLLERYGWALESGAFGSGLEAWLQCELITSEAMVKSTEQAKPVVVKIRRGIDRDVVAFDGDRCWFVLLSGEVVEAHAAFAATMRKVEEDPIASYSGEDPWTRSNLFGGGKLEAIVRGEHVGDGLALAVHWLRGLRSEKVEVDLGVAFDWLPGSAHPDYHKARWDERQPPEALVERLFRAPLRFVVHQGWGSLITHAFDDSPPDSFWPMLAADVQAQRRLLTVEEKGLVNGVERRLFFQRASCAIGMAVYLQLARIRLIVAGRREAVRLLCLPSEAESKSKLARRGAVDAQLRLLRVAAHVYQGAEEEKLLVAALRSFDEMEVFLGLVAAVEMASLGATVSPFELCRPCWEPIDSLAELMTLSDEEVASIVSMLNED